MDAISLQGQVFRAEPSDDGRMIWLTVVTDQGESLKTFGFTEDVGKVEDIPLQKITEITIQPYVKNGTMKGRVTGVKKPAPVPAKG